MLRNPESQCCKYWQHSEECMCCLRNIAMRDYQESMTTGQTDTHTHKQTDFRLSNPYMPLCFAGATQKLLSERLGSHRCIQVKYAGDNFEIIPLSFAFLVPYRLAGGTLSLLSVCLSVCPSLCLSVTLQFSRLFSAVF